ncbi:phage tail protein I [Amycolatopsis kentuckyensis]|uniref:phage tail protein I n=1 Tax=Amycolatopsis kentuckyensis TaxID=218823 RepID=UPI00117870C6|nr:phage tail protein I [Amycolatopsis kentuckyensis]
MTSAYLTDPAARRFAPVGGAGTAWFSFDGTDRDERSGDVLLAVDDAATPSVTGFEATEDPGPEPAGLAFAHGCLYRGDPDRGQIQLIRPSSPGPPIDLLGPVLPPPSGTGFTVVGLDPARPLQARALAADSDDHLFVLDGGDGRVAVLDLADGHQMRTVTFPHRPVDLAGTGGRSIYVLTGSRSAPLHRLDAIGRPEVQALEPAATELLGAGTIPPGARPARIAVAPDGAVWLLFDDSRLLRVRPGADPAHPGLLRVPGTLDLEFTGDGLLVLAGPPGDRLLTWSSGTLGVLRARGYDGRGLVRTPDGRIGYLSAAGFRIAVPRRVAYRTGGSVTTPYLDGLDFGRVWGRIFVEACVPPDTTLTCATSTTDDPSALPPAPTTVWRPLHRRETGRELAWAPFPAGDRYEVYEAPVAAPPGRHLVVWLRLTGTGVTTPRVRALRAELPGRDLITKLPRTYRRDPVAADLLRRFLAIIDGQFGEIESRAVQRDLLLDPGGAPAELLPWLASLVGLTLDTRWPEAARRTVLTEAMPLYRQRGTVPGLRRMLEIYLGRAVVILESFRLRGRAAAIGGADDVPGEFDAVLGAGWRVAGGPAPSPAVAVPERAAAHRFTVLLTTTPDDEQLAVVRDLLDLHRPAHTLIEVCSLGGGMRVGLGLHVEISSVVGPGSGFGRLRAGDRLGDDRLLGRGRTGLRVGGAGPGEVIDG